MKAIILEENFRDDNKYKYKIENFRSCFKINGLLCCVKIKNGKKILYDLYAGTKIYTCDKSVDLKQIEIVKKVNEYINNNKSDYIFNIINGYKINSEYLKRKKLLTKTYQNTIKQLQKCLNYNILNDEVKVKYSPALIELEKN